MITFCTQSVTNVGWRSSHVVSTYLIEHSSQVEDVLWVRVVPSRSRDRATRDSHQQLLWTEVHFVTAFVAVRGTEMVN